MIHFSKTSFVFCLFALLSVIILPAHSVAQSCDITPEAFTKLKKPNFESYQLWSAQFGEQDTQERFISSVLQSEGNYFAVGEVDTQQQDTSDRSIAVAKIDTRGRIIGRQFKDIEYLEEVVDMIPVGDGVATLVNLMPAGQKKEVLLELYDANGQIISERRISDKKMSIAGKDLILQDDGKAFILLTHIYRPGFENIAGQFSRIYTMDLEGEIIAERAIRPGLVNVLNYIHRTPDGQIYGAGEIERSGRMTGWVVRLDNRGRLSWQQSYSRGVSAHLQTVKTLANGNVIVGGHVSAPGDIPNGAWVALLDGSGGNMIWQRFYMSDFDLTVADMYVHDDGQISIMMNARNAKRPNKTQEKMDPDRPHLTSPERFFQDHVKMMQLNERGVTLNLVEYFNGIGFQGEKLVVTENNQRLIVGNSIVEYLPDTNMSFEESLEVKGIQSEDAVVVAVPSPELYKDPCAQ